jgi:hypothetical protein
VATSATEGLLRRTTDTTIFSSVVKSWSNTDAGTVSVGAAAATVIGGGGALGRSVPKSLTLVTEARNGRCDAMRNRLEVQCVHLKDDSMHRWALTIAPPADADGNDNWETEHHTMATAIHIFVDPVRSGCKYVIFCPDYHYINESCVRRWNI